VIASTEASLPQKVRRDVGTSATTFGSEGRSSRSRQQQCGFSGHLLRSSVNLVACPPDAVNVEIAEHCLQLVYEQPGRDIAARIASPVRAGLQTGEGNHFWEAMKLPVRWSRKVDPPPWPLQR